MSQKLDNGLQVVTRELVGLAMAVEAFTEVARGHTKEKIIVGP